MNVGTAINLPKTEVLQPFSDQSPERAIVVRKRGSGQRRRGAKSMDAF